MASDPELRVGLARREDEDAYLAALNVCFSGWGGRDMFEWVFRRPGAGILPDVLTLSAAGRPIAGSGVSYRRLVLANKARAIAGIMTGSWTLPEARGAGAFTRMIHGSLAIAATRKADLLLAFVTASNPSCRRLRAAGASLFPTSGIQMHSASRQVTPRLTERPSSPADADRFSSRPADAAFFAYAGDEWRGQFIDRAPAVTYVEDVGRWAALVQRLPSSDRVLALAWTAAGPRADALRVLAARAAAAGRTLTWFTPSESMARDLVSAGSAVTPCFLAALRVAPGAGPIAGPFAIENGDRM